jgi:hypothetical protein
VTGVAVVGVRGHLVAVEANVVRGLPSLHPDAAARRRRACKRTFESISEPIVDSRTKLDPYVPATSRHLGQCEYVGETDAGMLRVLLKVTDKGDYDWVECGSCEAGWQVAHYAESVG